MRVQHGPFSGTFFGTKKTYTHVSLSLSLLSDRLTGILLFVASIFLHAIVLDTIHQHKCWLSSSFLSFSHTLIPLCHSLARSLSLSSNFRICCIFGPSLLNFVSFVNSNKLSIVLNMCYPRSQCTQCMEHLKNSFFFHSHPLKRLKYLRVNMAHNECAL